MKKNNLFIGIILSVLVSNTAFGMYPPATLSSFFNRLGNMFSWKSTKKSVKNTCFAPFRCCIRKTGKEVRNQFTPLKQELLNDVEERANNIVNNVEQRANNVLNNAIHGNIAQDNFNTLIWMGVFGTAAIVTTYYITNWLCKYLEKKVSQKKSDQEKSKKTSIA